MKKITAFLDKIPNVYKTFAWNVFYQAVSAGLTYIVANLASLPIPAEYSVVLGLILSAISKSLLTKSK